MTEFELKNLHSRFKDTQLDVFLAAVKIVGLVETARAFHAREFNAIFPASINGAIEEYNSHKAKNNAAFEEWLHAQTTDKDLKLFG